VEAHGTGTAIGDPIELGSLKQVLLAERPSDSPCWIGSVKSNIGHLEAASGIAGLIKVIMSLRCGIIAPNIYYNTPTPHVSLENTPLSVPTSPIEWPQGKRRLAGISGFGFGGTNAHIIVEEAPVRRSVRQALSRPHHLLTLSAKSNAALQNLTDQYVDYFSQNPNPSAGDVCYSANAGRSHFAHRLSVAGSSLEEISQKLDAYRNGETGTGVIAGVSEKKSNLPVAFLFTGQGAQYPGMAKSLFDTQPVFRNALKECDSLLKSHLTGSLLDIIFNGDEASSKINQTRYTQPALFTVEYGLARMWQSFGIQPAAVMGHSVGEYAAACIAGVFGLEDGLKLIAARGRLMQELPEGGEMAAVLGEFKSIESALEKYADDVCIAAFNGPNSLVISGKKERMETALKELSAAGVRSKRLAVSHAFHSGLMAPMLDKFSEIAGAVKYDMPRIPLISNVSGKPADADIATPDYWRRHILSPVRFFQSMEFLHHMGVKIFLECGPDPVLLGMGRRCIDEKDCLWLPALRRAKSDWLQALTSLGELYVRGAAVQWDQVDKEYASGRVRLPNYAFQRKRYWIEGHEAAPGFLPPRLEKEPAAIHPLLGVPVYSALLKSGEKLFESVICPDSPGYLNDHKIFDRVVFPAAGYLEMAMTAGSMALQTDILRLQNVAFHRALFLDEGKPRKLQLVLSPENDGYGFNIFSSHHNSGNGSALNDNTWALHASGQIFAITDGFKENISDMHLPDKTFNQEIPVDQFYSSLDRRGLNYGITFRGIEKLWRKNGNALGKISLPEKLQPSGDYMFSPTLLDACFQSLAGVQNGKATDTFLPVGIEQMEVRRIDNNGLWCRTGMTESESDKILKADLDITDANGKPAARIEGLRLQKIKPEILTGGKAKSASDPLYELLWEQQEIIHKDSSFTISPGIWILFSDDGGMGQKIASSLESQGASCILAFGGNSFQHEAGTFRYIIDPKSPQDFQKLIDHANQSLIPVKGVVYLWPQNSTGDPPDELKRSPVLGCDSLLYLVQALASAHLPEMPRLWITTRQAQSVIGAEESLNVAHAPLWGLGRVIALEYPSLHCTRIDLDSNKTDDEAELLLESILHPDGEDQIAFRKDRRYVARLSRHGKKSGTKRDSLEIPKSPAFRLATSGYGILENLYLAPQERRLPGPDEVEIEVCASD